MKNRQFLTLNLSKDIAESEGVRFPKSERRDHFLKGVVMGTPSPATYYTPRLMEDDRQARKPSLSPPHRRVSQTASSFRGPSIPMFSSKHKSYIDHSKHKTYQP